MRFILVFLAVLVASDVFASSGYRISSWLPGWGNKHLNSTRRTAGYMTETNPVWYHLRTDGTIARQSVADSPRWRAALEGTELIPTIQNTTVNGFDPALTARILRNPKRRARHAEDITQLVVNKDFAGIDIDYEGVPASSRHHFTAFLRLLSEKLHAHGKKLSVTVYAKDADYQRWDGVGSQDYAEIGKVADTVKLMAYDFHYARSNPGPITPLDWLDRCVSYAKARIPADKLMVGLPLYGYEWTGSSANGMTYERSMERARESGATITRDDNGEAVFWHLGHVVYFNDAFSYERKVDLILQKHPEVAGFAHWAVGAEDPAVWRRIERLKGGNPAASPAPTFNHIGTIARVDSEFARTIPASAAWLILVMFTLSLLLLRAPTPSF